MNIKLSNRKNCAGESVLSLSLFDVRTRSAYVDSMRLFLWAAEPIQWIRCRIFVGFFSRPFSCVCIFFDALYRLRRVFYRILFGIDYRIGKHNIRTWIDCHIDWHENQIIVWIRKSVKPAAKAETKNSFYRDFQCRFGVIECRCVFDWGMRVERYKSVTNSVWFVGKIHIYPSANLNAWRRWQMPNIFLCICLHLSCHFLCLCIWDA